MEIYFDNSATTQVDERVIRIVEEVMRRDYGNPSSRHRKGVESEKYLKEAAGILAGILKVPEKELIFTSGGTESNNLALIGSAMANHRKGRHILATCFEHPSVLEPLKYLESLALPDGGSFEVQYLPVNREGHISLEELERSIRPDTILVSCMFVNNEIGAVQEIASIGKIIKEKNPGTLFHVDAIQAFGKYEIRPKKMKIDLMSVSGHKFHGPKGTGFLYKNEKVRLVPQILGGGQQKGMRSGTDNVPGVAGLSEAARLAYENLEQNVLHMTALKDRMTDGLLAMEEELRLRDPSGNRNGEYVKINSRKGTESAPHIVSATFFPVKSEVMLHALEDKGLYVSSGSACSSNKPGLSGTLQSIGLTAKEADCTIRFSFCETNTEAEVEEALKIVRETYEILRKFTAH
ncbi:MAG: cysteine desulfurase [Parasporobacterium sp.]|nr:cysteine desulfurase [Parasporobacterium sp.]